MAAEAIGFEPRLMDQRRRYDALLDRQWIEALDEADRRLSGVEGPYDPEAGDAPVVVVKRSSNGRVQLQKAGEKRWSRAVEDRFFATLAMCGNISASARAVGFSQSCIDQRRRKYPEFEARLQETLDDAELEIEFRMAAEVRGAVSSAMDESGMGTVTSNCPRPLAPGPFNMDAAMRFLKWREEKRHGRGRRDHRRVKPPPSIDEVTENIVRKVEAMKRHRARGGAVGDREDSPVIPANAGAEDDRRSIQTTNETRADSRLDSRFRENDGKGGNDAPS
jgi:hypothetical protein